MYVCMCFLWKNMSMRILWMYLQKISRNVNTWPRQPTTQAKTTKTQTALATKAFLLVAISIKCRAFADAVLSLLEAGFRLAIWSIEPFTCANQITRMFLLIQANPLLTHHAPRKQIFELDFSLTLAPVSLQFSWGVCDLTGETLYIVTITDLFSVANSTQLPWTYPSCSIHVNLMTLWVSTKNRWESVGSREAAKSEQSGWLYYLKKSQFSVTCLNFSPEQSFIQNTNHKRTHWSDPNGRFEL